MGQSLDRGIALALFATACGAAEPAEPKVAPASGTLPEPQQAEWIFATEGVRGGRKGECQSVSDWLGREQVCKGAFCKHGAALADDWMRSCERLEPRLVSDVERHRSELRAKARAAPAPCEAEVSDVLRNGCRNDPKCAELVQSWATRCAEWSTPLVVRMLEIAVERQTGEAFRLDARSCTDMFGELQKAASCNQQFACQDSLPAVERYRARCATAGKLPPLAAAIAELSVRAGANEKPAPIPVRADDAKVDPKLTPAPLADASGAVILVCGKRVVDVKAYLAASASCTEDVVLARRFEGPSGPVVRLGRFSHPNDSTFMQRFPSLALDGEVQARFSVALPTFVKAVEKAERLAADKQPREAIRALVDAIIMNRDAVRMSRVFDDTLRAHDEKLVPLFRALAEAKKKILHDELPERRFAPAVRRTKLYPLADVNADGRVQLGAETLAAGADLADMLPKSMAAYHDVLKSRYRRLAQIKPRQSDDDAQSMQSDGAASTCGQAMKRYEAAEKSLVACGFGVETCDDAKTGALEKDVDRARGDAEVEYNRATLAISNLREELRGNATTAATVAGCREPWW